MNFEDLQPGMTIISKYSGEMREIVHVGITIAEVKYTDSQGINRQYVIPRHVLEKQWTIKR